MAYQSRLKRHERKQTVLYLILSGIFIFLMLKWGLPALINLLSREGSSTQTDSGVDIPVQAPVFSVPEATFSSSIKVEGSALANQTVKLFVNSEETAEKPTAFDGSFLFENVRLKPGENLIGLLAVDEKGKESRMAEAVVVQDSDKPLIEISEPKDEASFFGADQQTIQIVGKVNEVVQLTINGNFVSVAEDGSFSYRVKLSSGVNELVVVAIDRAGNRSEKLIRVSFSS